jgi:hypothetical protein
MGKNEVVAVCMWSLGLVALNFIIFAVVDVLFPTMEFIAFSAVVNMAVSFVAFIIVGIIYAVYYDGKEEVDEFDNTCTCTCSKCCTHDVNKRHEVYNNVPDDKIKEFINEHREHIRLLDDK